MYIQLFFKYWREIAISSLLILTILVKWYYSHALNERDDTITLMAAEAKLCEIQKDTLRSAILTQNEAVEAHRIDEAKRAEEYKRKFVTISAKYAEAKKQLSGLSGDEECKAMREIINEAVK